MQYDLSRFITAHQRDYSTALSEIKRGRKTSHWMWYIFPQLKGLGRSGTSMHYGIEDLNEAAAFLDDPCLGANLREITQALLDLGQDNPSLVFGHPDDMKLRSCMTLFACAAPGESLFLDVLEQYFGGNMDRRTLRMLDMERMFRL